MKSILSIILISILSNSGYGQGFFNNWYFGGGAGLNFNSGVPVAINGSLSTLEGCATISDFNGNLLFYTDGITVWNANNLILTNGTGLLGNNSSTQSALIVPNPGNTNQYYIFTAPAGSLNSISYSIVDMSLSGGLGAITSVKNIVLHPNSTERVTAVCLPDGKGFWIIGHEPDNNVFFAYKLTATGIFSTPVLSSSGSVHAFQSDYVGYLKPSHAGNKLAIAVFGSSKFEVFDFNNSTGSISNAISFPPVYEYAYGVEFSPDDSRLYLSGGYNPTFIYQVDMNAGSNAAIINSSTLIASPVANLGMGALQIGPDSKIYVSKISETYLGVINSPNELSAQCNYVDNQIFLTSASSLAGLPNNYTICCSIPILNLGNDSTICQGEIITLNGGSADSYLWSNGSTSSSINVSTSGIYWVQASNGLCFDRDSINISDCDIEAGIELPNVFTPNNDGLNDSFIPVKYYGIAKAKLKIFNRWGVELFYTDNLINGWNGYYNGNICSDGTYYWIVQYTTNEAIDKELNGFLTLIK